MLLFFTKISQNRCLSPAFSEAILSLKGRQEPDLLSNAYALLVLRIVPPAFFKVVKGTDRNHGLDNAVLKRCDRRSPWVVHHLPGPEAKLGLTIMSEEF